MGFFSSLSKSSKLRKLQLELAPKENGSPMDMFQNLMDSAKRQRQEQAKQEYLDLCEADENVATVMMQLKLTRADLVGFEQMLTLNGAGGWAKGHYIPLSSIAYAEPLMFLAVATKSGTPTKMEIASLIVGYWTGQIPQGGLMSLIQRHG